MQDTNQNNPNSYRHTHDGINSPLLENSAIANALNAPQSALTPSSGSLSSGGAGTLSNSDSATLTNMQTRINQLESRLQAMGLLG